VGKWQRRIEREPDAPPPIPLRPGPASNGEFVPAAPSAHDRLVLRAALDRAEHAAARAGIDRRRFLQTSAGVAAFLSTFDLAACSRREGATTPSSTTGATSTTAASTTTAGGRYEVPEPEDVVACEQALARPGGFVFDVHTHHVVPDGPWRDNARRIADMIRGLVPAGCVEADPYRCVDRTAYLYDLFLASDTTISLLSDVPNSGPLDAPLPWEAKRETRALAEALAAPGAARVLLHDVIAPNFGDLSMRLDEMAATVGTGDVAAFKVYTAWGPDRQGFALDDPVIGIPVVEQARALGVRVMCGHKGLPLLEFDRRFNGPRDLVALAARYPDMAFVVYHGAYEIQTVEGPYDRDRATGIDTLVRALEDHGIGPNANVYAELGTTWREVLDHPDEAAHAVGKLLRYVGEDNVLWGTDAVWYGSPQPQILAFRAFQITEAFQAAFGYPALTEELKAKVFGSNAARLFGIDPDEVRCALDAGGLTAAREEAAALVTEGALPAPWQPRGPVSRRQVLSWLGSAREPWTP
jgi:hypothetical protein